MGMRATVIQYYINVRTQKKEKGRTKLDEEKFGTDLRFSDMVRCSMWPG